VVTTILDSLRGEPNARDECPNDYFIPSPERVMATPNPKASV
jgi:hypothetical protein